MAGVEFELETRGDGIAVLRMRGKEVIQEHELLAKQFDLVRDSAQRWVVLDLGRLEFLTSLTLREFLVLAKTKKAEGGGVAIAGANENVAKVFTHMRLEQIIPICATVEEAVAACGG